MKRARPILNLYPYQNIGVDCIINGFNALYLTNHGCQKVGNAFLLADEMGLGKTIQAFTTLSKNLICTKLPTLIVCPSSIIHIWSGQDLLFFPEFDDVRIFGNDIIDNLTTKSLVICSYSKLCRAFNITMQNNLYDTARLSRLNCKLPLKHKLTCNESQIKLYSQLMNMQWGHIIMDEIHYLKNPKGTKAKAVGYLDGQFRLGLTGTPVMNHGGDMISILKFGLCFFDANWSEIKSNPNGPNCRALLDSFTLCRTKEMVGIKKRDASNEIVILPWDNYNSGIASYRKIKTSTLRETDINLFFGKLQKLRQLCLYAPGSNLPSPKMIKLFSIFESLNRAKIVVVSSYKSFLGRVLSPWLTSKKVLHSTFEGGSRKRQQKALSEFENNDKVKMLLMVKQAGAIGLNLQIASSCVVIMDPHFNRALDEQAACRVDRIGQNNTVKVFRLFMQNSIDIAMLNLQDEKQKQTNAWTFKKSDKLLDYKLFKMHLNKFDTV